MATTDRFEVSDVVCGLVQSCSTFDRALKDAGDHQDRHQSEGARVAVTVFDRMAHPGRPEEWDVSGKAIAVRHAS